MNHQKIYENIISKAQSENRIKLKKNHKDYIYYENHHITPKCIGGNNDKDNLVLLTAREHYICHELLTYIYKGNRKLACAFHHMTFGIHNNKYILSSYNYKYARELISLTPISIETLHKYHNRIPWNKNKKGLQHHTILSKQKISIKVKGEKNPMYGRRGKLSPSFNLKRSAETKEKMKFSKINENNPNSGLYKIQTPDNKIFLVKGATTFVKQHPEYNINRHFIYTASKIQGFYKNWKIEKLN